MVNRNGRLPFWLTTGLMFLFLFLFVCLFVCVFFFNVLLTAAMCELANIGFSDFFVARGLRFLPFSLLQVKLHDGSCHQIIDYCRLYALSDVPQWFEDCAHPLLIAV